MSNIKKKGFIQFTRDHFYSLLDRNMIVDGRCRGLILGRSHEEDGIYTICGDNNSFLTNSSVEGGEYILNKQASETHRKELETINEYKEGINEFTLSFQFTPFMNILTCYCSPHDKMLWVEFDQFIVNRAASQKYMERLNEINLSSPMMSCNLNPEFAKGEAVEE